MMANVKKAIGKKFLAVAAMILVMAFAVTTMEPMQAQAAGGGSPTKICVPRSTGTKICVSVNVRWKKSNGADGYVVYRSSSRWGGFKKIKDIQSDGVLAYNDSSVDEAKVYYYKVRAYKNCSGKKVFCKFTSVKLNKVMKTVEVKETTIWGRIKKFLFG